MEVSNTKKDYITVLSNPVALNKFQLGVPTQCELSPSDNLWLQQIVDGLCGDLDDEDLASLADTNLNSLTCKLLITRKNNAEYREHLIVRASVAGHYHTPCVRCLVPTKQEFETEFFAVFIPEEFEKQKEYEELMTVLCENEEAELYFHNRKTADFTELLNEQIQLVCEPLPLHDANCLGLCPKTGKNLNNNPEHKKH